MAERRAILLSGEHPTLPAAELRALLEVHDPGARVAVAGSVGVVQPEDEAGTDAALARMALAHEWGIPWGEHPETETGLEALAQDAKGHGPRTGTAAVVATRRGAHRGIPRVDVERRFGLALRHLGHTIDLVRPQRTYFAWLEGGRITAGERKGALDRAGHEHRASDERAHFSPVSLHPRRAASLLHLARVPPGGRVLDPFCGPGAFVLEAALEGYEAWGSDLDPLMVQGTLQTLADQGPQPLGGAAVEADVGKVPDLVEGVQGIVTDFPYGRASSSHDEGLADLYGRAFDAFRRLLPVGGHAVVGHALLELLPDLRERGFEVVERHEERVHKSLTRHYLVARRTD